MHNIQQGRRNWEGTKMDVDRSEVADYSHEAMRASAVRNAQSKYDRARGL